MAERVALLGAVEGDRRDVPFALDGEVLEIVHGSSLAVGSAPGKGGDDGGELLGVADDVVRDGEIRPPPLELVDDLVDRADEHERRLVEELLVGAEALDETGDLGIAARPDVEDLDERGALDVGVARAGVGGQPLGALAEVGEPEAAWLGVPPAPWVRPVNW